MASSSAASSAADAKEVDYYLNPTELFRWINYRRWDGAKSRAVSHPEECSTWIVSRHNTDGRILWRHLPLHLICMQKEAACGVVDEGNVQAVVANRQMEELMDVLLDSYPDGASSPDDQGMLPLHLLLSKADGEPNVNTINLLLSSFPNAVDVRDKFGRTPHDILRESCGDVTASNADGGPPPGGEGVNDRSRAAFRALKRARYVADKITSTIRDESANIVAAVQHEASNERGASQKIIVRLEEELNKGRKEMEERDARERAFQDDIRRMQGEVGTMKTTLNESSKNLDVTRRERDELLASNEAMREQLDNHNEIVEQIKKQASQNREGDLELIANLKSEVSTSKAMSEALESQLRSRFTNEEYLSSAVGDLEEQLTELKVGREHSIKKHQHEIESFNADNKKLKWNNDELTKKNAHLQAKLKDLNKQMSQIISSYSTLNTEHDRLLELAQNYERNLLESVRSERAQLMEHFAKQREMIEKSFIEQEQIVESSLKTQDSLAASAKADRSRGKGTVEKLRSEFQQLRAAAAERERTLHVEEVAASRKMKRFTSTPPRKSDSESLYSSSGGESRNPHHTTHGHYQSSPSRPLHPPPSTSATSDGHLMRLLDQRAAAAAQASPRRGLGVSTSTSATDSSAPGPPQYYKQYQQGLSEKYNLQNLMKSDYSAGQYSHDESETTESGQYSECSSSQYTKDDKRTGTDPPPSPPSAGAHHHSHHYQQPHPWKHHQYGSYGESTE